MRTFLALPALCFVSTMISSCATSPVPSQAGSGASAEAFSILDPSGKEIVRSADVACLTLMKDEAGKDLAMVRLERPAALRFQDATRANLGKKLSVRACGREVNSPVVMAEISAESASSRGLAVGLDPAARACFERELGTEKKC